MTAQKTNVSNGAESTLSSSLSSGATTINVTDTSAFPSVPFYAVIDPDVDATREVVLVDGSKTATTFVLSAASKRGQDGTTDTAHSSGAKVACVPVAALWTDINDRVDAAYTAGGTDVAVADGGTGASTAAAARTNLGLVIGTDVQAHSSVLDNTTASFTTADETKLDGIEPGATADQTASEVSITDAGGYFVGTEVETALQELGADVAALGGGPSSTDRAVIPGFIWETSVIATATQAYRVTMSAGAPALNSFPVVMDRAGSIVGLAVAGNNPASSGTMTFEVYKNGAATGFTVTYTAGQQWVYATQAAGTDTFTAGNRLDVRATNSSHSGATSFEASVTVEFS